MASDPSPPEREEKPEQATGGEAVAASAAAKAAGGRGRGLVAGAAIGIGSAALVAALLYARSTRNKNER